MPQKRTAGNRIIAPVPDLIHAFPLKHFPYREVVRIFHIWWKGRECSQNWPRLSIKATRAIIWSICYCSTAFQQILTVFPQYADIAFPIVLHKMFLRASILLHYPRLKWRFSDIVLLSAAIFVLSTTSARAGAVTGRFAHNSQLRLLREFLKHR